MMHNTGVTGGSTAVATTPLNRGPQPGWMTLNQARDAGFTGEIVFEIEPEVRVYVDNGEVYFAERSTDAPLAQRLLQAGLVDRGQLERGTVRVGDVEHLGRLFDRDATVDRDSVMVVTETETQAIVAEIANEAICTVRSTAYRHHPSGLHRWFATPLDGADRGFGVSSLETSVVEDIPRLPIVTEHTLVDQLYIEWDEPIIGGAPVAADETLVEEFDESMLQAMLDESAMQYDIIESDEVADIDRVTEIATIEIDYAVNDGAPSDGFEIQYILTDGFEVNGFAAGEPTFDAWEATFIADGPAFDAPIAEARVVAEVRAEPVGVESDDVEEEFQILWPNGAVTDVAAPEIITMAAAVQNGAAPVDTDSTTELQSTDDLAMTPIEAWDEEIVAEVPAEVTEAVKRAIAALERITGEVPVVAPIKQPSEFEDRNAARVAPVAATFGGFAPPSLDMSAEAIYARATAQMQADAGDVVTSGSDPDVTTGVIVDPVAAHSVVEGNTVADHAPAAGVASVVFVDDVAPGDPGGDANERSSALRRLIGSLRRKDR